VLSRLSLPRLPLYLRLALWSLAGAATILAFAPFDLWPLQIALLAALLHAAAGDDSVRGNLLRAWAFGFGWMVCGIYWLYVSMTRYGGMPGWMAALAVVLLALYMAAWYGLAFGAAAWLRQRLRTGTAGALLLLFPAAWGCAEWLRGWVFTGFPWVSSGYAHASGPLAGFAPLLGVYGIGWLAAAAAAGLALLPRHRLALAVPLFVLAAGAGLRTVEWTRPHGQPISVRLAQGNVPQELKFDREQLAATLALYREMMMQAPADLVAIPETALPVFLHRVPQDYLDSLHRFAAQSGSHLMLGVPVSEGPQQYANSAIGIAPAAGTDGRPLAYRYDKHHLVPFGEFVPWGFRWFVDMMHIPLGDFSGAPVVQPAFRVKDQAVLPNICYEDLFGGEIAAQIRAGSAPTSGATILLNMSNIAWFGDTLALPQHLQISQMRSLETGRPMLRSTNTGVTAVIDARGQVAAQLPPHRRDTLAATVQGHAGLTPFVRFGNALPLALFGMAAGAAWLMGRKRHSGTENR